MGRTANGEVARLEQHLSLLSETIQAFSEATDEEGPLVETIARKLAEVLGVSCAIAIPDDAGKLVPVAVQAPDKSVAARLRAELLRFPMPVDAPTFTARAFRTGEPMLVPEFRFDAVTSSVWVEILRTLEVKSMLAVPVREQGVPVGVMHLARYGEGAAPFDERDLFLAQLLADHAGLALATRRLAASRRQAEARFARLAGSGFLGVVVASLTGSGLFEANDAFLRMLGYPREELLATPWEKIVASGAPDLDAQANLRESGSTGVRERELIRKDGTRIPVLYLATTLGEEEKGKVIACVLDLSAQRKAEGELEKDHVRFRALIENSSDAIVLSSAEGVITYASPATTRILRAPVDQIVGRSFMEWIPPEDRAQTSELRTRTLGGEVPPTPDPALRRVLRSDGTHGWVEVVATNLVSDPAVGAMVVNVRDVTDRKLAEDALAAAEREKTALELQVRQAQKMEAIGRLAGGVAHDFNNALSVILSYAQLLSDRLEEGDPRRAEVEEITRAGARTAALTRQLLLFSRKEIVEPRPVDLSVLLADVDDMLRRIVGDDIELTVRAPSRGDEVLADPSNMEQLVLNLVFNARDAMPKGGKLGIFTDSVTLGPEEARALELPAGRYVTLSVIDDGIGMDEETRSRIFEPFFTTKPRGEGTGLGLSTVFGIVKQSGGAIQVTSELDKGTTIRILLPRMEVAPAPTAKRAEPETVRGTETILLVEDEDQVRAVIRSILKRAGYEILEARGAGAAIALAEHQARPIHLLLTDVVMPEVNGATLASQLVTRWPSLKVLCMSGYTDDSIVQYGVLDGRFDFLPKPFTPKVLLRKIREVLDADVLS